MKEEMSERVSLPEKPAGESGGQAREARKEKKEKKEKSGTITVRQVKSGISTPRDQKAALRGLGFSRLGQRVSRPDTPAVWGMIRKVQHLVVVEAEEKGE